MAAILEALGLTKTFGAVSAASNVTVQIEQQAIVGLIGANGAGKTTFINLVTGHLRPTAGTVRYQGREITGLSPRQVTQLGICRSFQIPQLFNSLTTFENLLVATGIVARSSRQSAAEVLGARGVNGAAETMLARFKLETYRAAPASVLPEGVRKLVDIAMALVSRPKVLLLDEPTSGVSAEEKFALMDLVLAAIQGEGATVLFVEHDMDIVRRYAQRLIAFYEGRIIADGRPDSVLSDSEVRKLVVGEEGARARAAGGSAC